MYEKAQQAKLADMIIVATDDKRIYDAVKAFGGEVEMTSVNHKCGSDRIREVVERHNEISFIVNWSTGMGFSSGIVLISVMIISSFYLNLDFNVY